MDETDNPMLQEFAAKPIKDIRAYFWNTLADYMAPRAPVDDRYASDVHAFMRDMLWVRTSKFGVKDELRQMEPLSIQLKYAAKKAEAIAAGKKPWYLVLKARRFGITTYEQALSFHLVCTQRLKKVQTFAETKDKSSEIWQMVNRFYDNMPPQFRPKRGPSHAVIQFPELDSWFGFYTAGGKAPSRGDTLSRFHGSEVAWWDLNDSDFDNLIAGIQGAAEHGEIVLETTAHGAAGWFYTEFLRALDGHSEYTAIFLPWYEDPSYARPLDPGEVIERTDEEKERSASLGPWSDEQIKFRREMQRTYGRLFPQEYPETVEEAYLVKGSCWFDVEICKARLLQVRPVVESHDNGNLLIWTQPKEGETYYIGADTAEGVDGGDFDTAVVLDRSGAQVAALHGHWPTEIYGKKLAALGRYYNDAWVAVEANNHGHSVLNTLRNAEHYKTLYQHRDYDADPGAKPREGWQTNGKTRPIMIDDLRNEAIEGRAMSVNDPALLRECMSFCLASNGTKYEALPGAHDDRVMAAAIAWQVRKTAPRKAGVWLI